MTEQSSDSADRKQVGIEWWVPDDMQAVYANHLVAQHTADEFTLFFFSINQPFLLGTEEDRRQQMDAMSTVRARCVSQIVVAPARMKAFIEMLQANYDTYVNRHADLGDE